MTHVHFFFSVHEQLFDRVAAQLSARYGVTRFSGFVWGRDQERYLSHSSVEYDPLIVFSRDIKAGMEVGEPDLAYLRVKEEQSGISIQRMIAAERHLQTLPYDRLLRLIELLYRRLETFFEEDTPSFIFSESVSCLTSYIYLSLARIYGVPFWQAMSARMENRIAMSDRGLQDWQLTSARFARLRAEGLSDEERIEATEFVSGFREKPSRPSHMKARQEFRAVSKKDVDTLWNLAKRRSVEPENPTLGGPARAVLSRASRLVRAELSERLDLFERPVEGEQYVLYPIHFQPEATTLVQAPYYLDQATLIEDVAKSLPVGYRLYVKEHFSNRGRRPLSFYNRIRAVPAARLLGPDEDSWKLLANASAVATITGSMGWEGLLMGKPVVSFGKVFYAECPLVHRADDHPKDDWYRLMTRVLLEHEHDEEMLLMFVSAVLRTTFAGFVKNANTFPRALSPENIENIARAYATVSGIAAQK